MTKSTKSPRDVWAAILAEIDEKMQFGLLQQARTVLDIQIDGEELVLLVDSDEPEQFFSQSTNQQRLLIMARAVIDLRHVTVKRAPTPQ